MTTSTRPLVVVHRSSEIGGAACARSVTRATAPGRVLAGTSEGIGKRLCAAPSAPAPHPSSCQSGTPSRSATVGGSPTTRRVSRLANVGGPDPPARFDERATLGMVPSERDVTLAILLGCLRGWFGSPEPAVFRREREIDGFEPRGVVRGEEYAAPGFERHLSRKAAAGNYSERRRRVPGRQSPHPVQRMPT